MEVSREHTRPNSTNDSESREWERRDIRKYLLLIGTLTWTAHPMTLTSYSRHQSPMPFALRDVLGCPPRILRQQQ